MKRTFIPSGGSLLVLLFICITGSLFAQNYQPTAGSDTILFYPSDGITSISDPGGPGGSSAASACNFTGVTANNYTNCDCHTIIRLCPDVTGKPLTLNFSQFGVVNPDYFVVYDGPDTNSAVIYNNNTNGINSNDRCYGPQIVRSTHPDGCLTVRLFANATTNEVGFLAAISIPDSSDAGIAAVLPNGAATAGTNNVQVQVKNDGLKTITNVMVEWSFGGVPQTPFNYVGSIAPGQTSPYFTIGTANVVGGETLRVWTSMPNGVADTQNANDTLSRQLCVGMAGNYTINFNLPTAGTNFASFTAAIAGLTTCGVSGAVTFDVTPGTYAEQVTIPAITGTSATNNITFRSTSTDSTLVKLQWAGSSAAAGNFVLALSGSKHLSFERITFERTGALSTYQTLVVLSNGTLDNSFLNCQFLAPLPTSTTTPLNRSSIYAASGALHNGTTVRNSYFNGNSCGIWVDGIAGTSGDFIVANNTFQNSYVGVFFLACRNTAITNNIIQRPSGATSAYFAVSLRWVLGGSVTGNRIATNSGGENGIRLREVIGTAATPVLVANNFVQTGGTVSGTAHGISLEEGNSYIDVVFNSVNITGGNATTGRAFNFEGGPNNNIRLLNNNLVNAVSGYSMYVDGGDAVSALASNYNNLFTNGNVLAYWNGTFANNLPLLILASGQDVNSVSVNPNYTGVSDLHTSAGQLNGAGQPFAGITTDIDGDVRDAQNPDIGADEFAGLAVDAGIAQIISPGYPAAPGTYNLDVEVANYGTTTLTSATLQWEFNGVPQPDVPYTGSLATGQTDTVTLGVITPGSGDQVKAWTALPNGGADAANSNDTISTTLCISLVGTFTINSALPTGAGNFASFTDAATALGNCGIGGPVVFNVVPGNGPFTEQVTIPAILGSSATNTVTFNCFGDTLQFDPPTADKYILRLNGAQYVTFDSLYIRASGTTFGYGVLFQGNASHNTIRKSTVDLSGITVNTTTTANTTAILFNATTNANSTTTGNNGSFNLIENNLLRYGAYGIRVGNGEGNRIIGNKVFDNYSSGILLSVGSNGTIVDGNTISRPTRTNSTTYSAIEISGISENCRIINNIAHGTNTAMPTNTSSIYVFNTTTTGDATPGNENIWANNLAYDIGGIGNSGVVYGFNNDGGNGAYYFHNTIVNDNQFSNSSGASKGLNLPSETHNVKIIGNIFYMTRSGSNTVKNAMTIGNTSSTVELDYNVYYVVTNGADMNLGRYGSTNYATLADWQALGFDLNSYEVDPYFVDTVNKNFMPQNPFFNNVLANLGFSTDIYGTARGPLTDPGAIEFDGLPNDVGVWSFVSPSRVIVAGTQNVEVDVRNYGTNTVNSFDVQWSLNGAVQSTVPYTTPLPTATNTAPIALGTYNAVGGDTLKAWTMNPNGGADGFMLNDTLTLITCIGLSGTYTINSAQPTGGTNFVSFFDAIDTLMSCGVAGPVVFDVVQGSGPYNEQITIPAINGASATNTITFQGHGDTLEFAPTTTLKYVVRLSGAKHVIIDNLVIRPQGVGQAYGILLRDGCDSVTITNNIIDLSLVGATTAANATGLVISGSNSAIATTAPLTASNTLIENNTFISGVHAISIIGNTDGSGASNNRIIGNTILDYYTDAILLTNTSGTIARNNDISRPTRSTAGSSISAFRLAAGVTSSLIDGNKIHNSNGASPTSTTSNYPIFVNAADAPVGRENVVMNNLIYNINNNGLIYGIYNLGSDGNFVYNNTIVLDHTASTATLFTRGLWQSSAATNVEYKNNIVYITRGGSADKWGIHLNTATSDVVVENNVYYVNGAGGNNYIGFHNGNSYLTLAGWQTANNGAFDQNGFNRDPRFVDIANDDYTPTSTVINDQAEPLAVVTTDIFGAPRSATPDPGAIEFVPLDDDASTIALLSPAAPLAPGNYPIEVVIQNLGALDLTDVNIYVNINDGVLDTTLPVFVHAPILLGSTETDTITIGTFDFTSTSYTITVWTSEPNGAVDANQSNDTLVVNICLALPAGNYTINASQPASATNFQSFGAAASALSCGILGNVVFDVAAGTGPYSEQVTIPAIPGTSASATVTFNGNGNTLTHNGSIKFATLLLDGADWLIFDNLTFQTTSFGQGFGIQLKSEADHNTIRNSTVLTDEATTNTSNYGIVASSSETVATGDGNNANHLLIDNVTIRGGYGGIRLEGAAGILLTGNQITNCTLLRQHFLGIYMDDADSVLLAGNYVDSLRDATNGDGVILFDMNGYFEVSGNKIYAPDVAMQINDGNTANAGRSKVVNNFIHSTADYGLFLDASERIDVYHNTVVGTIALRMATNATGYDIRNNIFFGLTSFAFDNAVAVANTSFVDLDNNLYYTNGGVLARYGGTTTAFDYASLAQWRGAFPNLNQNSLFGDPVFNSPKDLHILGTLANDAGDNTVGVTVDIDGDARPMAPSTNVDIGADEYTPFSSNIQVVSVIQPRDVTCGDSSATVSVVIYNQGTAAQGNFDVQVDVTGAVTQTISTTYVGPIAPQTFDTVVVGTINTYAGGTINLFAQHLLATDQYPVNDTLTRTISILPIPAAPVAVGDTGCVGDFLELTADVTGFVEVEWYDDASLTNSVGSGDVFFTPGLTTTTNYYVVGYQGLRERTGKPAITTTGAGNFITTGGGWGIEFVVTDDILIDSFTVYPTGTGTLQLVVWDLDNGNAVVWTGPILNVTGTGAAVQIPVGYNSAPGRFGVGIAAYSGITLARDNANAFPYVSPSGRVSVNGGKTSFANLTTATNYWFYDWVVRIPGCTTPAGVVTAFISAPVSDAGPNDTICVGETATLTAQNGVAWNWSNGQTTQTINVSPINSTTYNLTITDALGCPGTVDQTTVVVNPLPVVSAGADTAVCAGELATFTATGAPIYVWSTGATTASITVSAGGTYTVTGTDNNGCSNTDNVVLNARPLPSGNAGADVVICEGASVTLSAINGVDYEWSTGATTADITVSPTTTTAYNLTTTDQFGCVGEDTVTVTVNALPVLTITVSDTICITQTNLALTATPSGGTFTGPGVSGGVFDASLVGAGTYTINYSYTDGNGCGNTASKQIVVDNSPGCTPGIGSLAGIQVAGVYPNPFQDEVNIEFTATSNEPVTISIYNLVGQIIFKAEVNVTYGLNTYTIDTDRSLADGFYVIELRKGDQSYKEKLLRVR